MLLIIIGSAMPSETTAIKEKFEVVVLICEVIGFIIAFAIFLSTYFQFGLPIAFTISVSFFMLVSFFVLIDWRRLLRVRFPLPFSIHSQVVIDLWKTEIEINSNGDALIVHNVKGKVSGFVRWLAFAFTSDEEQPKFKSLGLEAMDVLENKELDAELMLDEPRYKRIRLKLPKLGIHNFLYRIRYRFLRTFVRLGSDYYTHKCMYDEKEICIEVRFPREAKIEEVRGEIVSQFGRFRKKTEPPRLIAPNVASWRTKNHRIGDSVRLYWRIQM